MEKPSIIAETENYAVVFKPPRMHCAPLHDSDGGTFFNWYAKLFPPIMEIPGRKKGEGGLLHRLDFETQGLVLFAKNQQSLDVLLAAQEDGKFIKEYSAICKKNNVPLPGFPPPPDVDLNKSFIIESCFRPFGPGRKQVRPAAIDSKKELSGLYQTEVVSVMHNEHYAFTIRLAKGFRHQIRCHLAWLGYPVMNDPLYCTRAQQMLGETNSLPKQPQVDGGADGNQQPDNDFLALRSHGLIFPDPKSGVMREYRIEPLEKPAN